MHFHSHVPMNCLPVLSRLMMLSSLIFDCRDGLTRTTPLGTKTVYSVTWTTTRSDTSSVVADTSAKLLPTLAVTSRMPRGCRTVPTTSLGPADGPQVTCS